ncbi:MAG: M13 family peptidase [Herminiimonas sp.]|nr:M13 family peptidase [Herminiimonas sp.]
MKSYFPGALCVALASGCSTSPVTSPVTEVVAARTAAPMSAPASPSSVLSGIDRSNFDASVRIQDDFYQSINGTWLKKTEIPADKSGWGAFLELRDATLPQLRSIIEDAARNPANVAGSEQQKIGDLFASFTDEARRDALGLEPLEAEFAKIAALTDKKQIPALIAHFSRIGVTTPYDITVHQDAKDATRYIADLSQSGLGLPDRDYYLKDDDAKLKESRAKYQAQIETMMAMAGHKSAATAARDIVELETRLAGAQWTKVQNRDPVKTYNRVELASLPTLAPGFDWKAYLGEAGIDGKISYLVVSQPSYLTGFSQALNDTPLETWKTYFSWHLLNSYAPYLSKSLVDQRFAFYGTVLRGVPQNEPVWKRAIRLEESVLGEALGKLYVARHFPPENKARMEKLVGNLLEAYRRSIDTLDWMSPATKKEAQAKLATFVPKIGYPSRWRDYAPLVIAKDDLVGNVRRANAFEYQRNIDKLGKPIDRQEWFITPQTVNAYYNPEMNEIVFPAAILQPPFFNGEADDAVNYGGIGAVIGHEISHGFDDQGSQYDGLGNLRDWWTKEDHARFSTKTAALIKQYGAYSPVAGYQVNGELTLGENIADNSGLAIAFKAYRLSLAGKPAPVIDGLTGDQRFYIGFGQVWRSKTREQETIVRIKTDPHAPDQFRGNGTVLNQDGFYGAFTVNPGDKMYLPPEQRVTIW